MTNNYQTPFDQFMSEMCNLGDNITEPIHVRRVKFSEKQLILRNAQQQANQYLTPDEPIDNALYMDSVHAAHNSLLYEITCGDDVVYYWLPLYIKHISTRREQSKRIVILHHAFVHQTIITYTNEHALTQLQDVRRHERTTLRKTQRALLDHVRNVYEDVDMQQDAATIIKLINDAVEYELTTVFDTMHDNLIINHQYGTWLEIEIGPYITHIDMLAMHQHL